ncbi:hypothetical protein [Pseudovibrio sp. POLY-S9]|uniref:hypothetical protein n=1 Tax=Pseudovibrio sp. POLY-S9 TaxID=1576596 RepID=UPI00070DBA1A|nr:hypothetical protein [Pseudovibrio sp. POLY-S9]
MSYYSPEAIVNRACARVGLEPLQSLTDDLPGGQGADLIYKGLISFLLGHYPWSFARTTRQLSKLHGVTAFAGYRNVFQLPPDRLGPPQKLTISPRDPDSTFTDFTPEEDKVHADVPELYALIPYFARPDMWSAAFMEAATLALAAELVMAIASREKKRDALRRDVYGTPQENMRGGLIGVAIQAEAQGTPSKKLKLRGNPLTQHFQGG